jgi:hypothetical protein
MEKCTVGGCDRRVAMGLGEALCARNNWKKNVLLLTPLVISETILRHDIRRCLYRP